MMIPTKQVDDMKSERITILGTPEFKMFLAIEADKEGISISELVRRRCEQSPSEEELVLAGLAEELMHSVANAQQALTEGLQAIQDVLATANTAHQTEQTA